MTQEKLISQEIPLGTWRTHFSYNSATTLAVVGNKIFAGSENGCFYFEKEFNSSVIQSKIDGFSDIAVKKLKYAPVSKILILTYTNGDIDLLEGGKITNVPTIKNADANINKTINHILIYNSTAFISSGFGLVVLDLSKKEIKEVYQNIGSNGSTVEVFSSAIFQDKLYLASSRGLMFGTYASNINLQDFNNWTTFSSESNIPDERISGIVTFNDALYAGINNQGIYRLEGSKWILTSYPPGQNIRSMSASSKNMIVVQDKKILDITPAAVTVVTHPEISTPFEGEYDSEQNLWIADSLKGLLKYSATGIESFVPNGPMLNHVNRLRYINGKTIVLPADFSAPFDNTSLGFSIFSNGNWANYNSFQTGLNNIPPIKNFASASFDPNYQVTYYGSLTGGILKQNADNTFLEYNSGNSPLQSTQSFPEFTSVGDIALDWESRLWITNYDVAPGQPTLYSKDANDDWKSYSIDHPFANSIVQILIDYANQKWLRVNPALNNSGILVFDEATGAVKHLNTKNGEGGLFNSQINKLAIDKSGYIWAATNNGISVFYNTYDVFESTINATRPIYQNQYLLKDNKLNCITIDGGDRKWIGSETGGVWLFNEDVSEMIYHFTTKNSPLPSDKIIDVTVHEETGEVFIATDKGIVSFRADATESETDFSNVKIFPNPIFPGFNGIVGISGLSDNTTVKITNVAGNLVFQTLSSGGTASWDISRNNLKTGIYFVFSVSENGEESMISKVAVIE